jgi:Mg2+-importing ATPase
MSMRLTLGTVVPADMRLLAATALECDESVLTGESLPAEKTTAAVPPGAALGDLASVALMGTIVHAGSGTGVVVATGAHAEFGRIAVGLSIPQPETDFQAGLRRFSVLLLRVALGLSLLIVITSLLLRRPLIDSLLFALAIAVGITPQLLPAVVSTSLAAGSRRLAQHRVLVKRLVSIEDLGDMNLLVTDKTGTLTEGRITFAASVNPAGGDDRAVRDLGLLAVDPGQADGAGNPLDSALGRAAGGWPPGYERLASLPFDHERTMASTLVRGPEGRRLLVTKGAPEAVLAASTDVPGAVQATLDKLFAGGSRVVAVASRDASGLNAITPADETGLTLAGFLVFLDPPKASTCESLRRLNDLGVQVKIATGDNAKVAQKLYADIGMPATRAITGPELDQLSDNQLRAAADQAGIFARVSPEQKARLIRVLRREGRAVGFLGDGVNDALALHGADVGISVDDATDVAKDAADVILLEKSRLHDPDLPAAAAVPDPAEQPALRQQPAGHPRRPRRS